MQLSRQVEGAVDLVKEMCPDGITISGYGEEFEKPVKIKTDQIQDLFVLWLLKGQLPADIDKGYEGWLAQEIEPYITDVSSFDRIKLKEDMFRHEVKKGHLGTSAGKTQGNSNNAKGGEPKNQKKKKKRKKRTNYLPSGVCDQEAQKSAQNELADRSTSWTPENLAVMKKRIDAITNGTEINRLCYTCGEPEHYAAELNNPLWTRDSSISYPK